MTKQGAIRPGSRKLFLAGTACLGLLLFSFAEIQFPPILQKKVDNAVRTTYGIETYSLSAITVSEELKKSVKAKLDGDHLFKVVNGDSLIGYIYVGEAPSMKKVFDYIILFDPDLRINKSKVLIYREDYGLQIGSQRWLKQFTGLGINDNATYGGNIDAIAGATISAESMTKATNEVLETLKKLREAAII